MAGAVGLGCSGWAGRPICPNQQWDYPLARQFGGAAGDRMWASEWGSNFADRRGCCTSPVVARPDACGASVTTTMDDLLARALLKVASEEQMLAAGHAKALMAMAAERHEEHRTRGGRGRRRDALCGLRPTAPSTGTDGLRDGDNCMEDLVQGITGARLLKNGSVEVRTTLLVAGFIIGSGGSSIREIVERTGAEISSWMLPKSPKRKAGGRVRVFAISGSPQSIRQALSIFLAAVSRYKQLVEGSHA
ncbi:unnamed protein product, partial [Ostreobium quekettii]